ncbi:MAG: Trk system potassium transporter TrkA, partial [Oscillospiraceae bacterium]|nr:Trk system potassium transporter TrkA [Oscillospiraceae bacterium]
SFCVGKPISQLKLRPNIIICALIRSRHCIIPDGSTVIEPGDHAVVICSAGKLRSLDDIIEVK